jgi:hypothetical protein
MSVIDEFFKLSPPKNLEYVAVLDIATCLTSSGGRYFVVTCEGGRKVTIQWYQFDVFEPILEQFTKTFKKGLAKPLIPLVHSRAPGEQEMAWHFAHELLRPPLEEPKLKPITPAPIELELPNAFRLQVSVSGHTAQRFTEAARARGLTRQNYLLELVDHAVIAHETASSGPDNG